MSPMHQQRTTRPIGILPVALLLCCSPLTCLGQIEPKQLSGILSGDLVSSSVSEHQLRHYLVSLVA